MQLKKYRHLYNFALISNICDHCEFMGHPVGLYLVQNMAISRELNSIRFCNLM